MLVWILEFWIDRDQLKLPAICLAWLTYSLYFHILLLQFSPAEQILMPKPVFAVSCIYNILYAGKKRGSRGFRIWIYVGFFRFFQWASKAFQDSSSPCCFSRLLHAKCDYFFMSVMRVGFLIPALSHTWRGVHSCSIQWVRRGCLFFPCYCLFFFSFSYHTSRSLILVGYSYHWSSCKRLRDFVIEVWSIFIRPSNPWSLVLDAWS